MERLKGLLKRRRSSGAPTLTSSISEMEVVSDPENTPENLPSKNRRPGEEETNDDNTCALMMDRIEVLTMEKYSIETRLSDVTSELERTKEENLDLKSKCDDLLNSLELERRRFKWQQRFFEKRIQQLTGVPASDNSPAPEARDLNTLRSSRSVEDLLDCNAFYEDTIKALVIVQDRNNDELKGLRTFYEDKLKNLSRDHEADISEIIESHNFQVQSLQQENEALIRDLLTGCEGLFDDLRTEFIAEARQNVELETSSGENIIVQFKGLPPLVKGIVVAGITVISIATAGWASWGFIIWVWPRLIAFAEVLAANPETFAYLLAFLNSVPFQAFLRSWEEGSSLGDCLKSFANTEFLSNALRMAPDLFSQFKKFPRPVTY